MENVKEKNMTRFLLTFFLGWIGSLIINCTDLKPKGYKSRTLDYIFLTMLTGGIYGLVASIANLNFDPNKPSNIGYVRDTDYEYENKTSSSSATFNQVKVNSKQKQSEDIKEQLKKIVIVVMSFFSLITLFYPLNATYINSGFDFIVWRIEAPFICHFLSLFILTISIVLIVLSIINFNKTTSFGIILPILSIVCTVIYVVLGIIANEHCFYNSYNIIYPKGLFIELILFFVYCAIDKLNFSSSNNTNEDNDNEKTLTESSIIPNEKEIEILEKLVELKEKGIISQDEFEMKKKLILGL